MAARVTLYSSGATGSANNCHVSFNVDLPYHAHGYQLCVESFATASAVSSGYVVSATGPFSMPTWDSAAKSERVNLVVSATGSVVNSVQKTSVGFRLGGGLKNQTLNVSVWDVTGAALYGGFPNWIMNCVIIPTAF